MNLINDDYPKYSICDLETLLQRDTFWLFKQMEANTAKKLSYNDYYIAEESYIVFIKWYNKYYSCNIPIPTHAKRAYSTTHRIEVAYRTKYCCASCKMLLPPTFEIDHIIELRDGGKDEYTNLQALCPNCHSIKTRANTLKKNKVFAKEFTKRVEIMEENAFDTFRFKN
jgi:hypothetical protein